MGNLYGLIGERLEHSFSPAIHSMIMERLGISGYYHLFEIEKNNLLKACSSLKYLNIKGVNVTIPYKIDVMETLDAISDEAKRIGAVNTISFSGNMSKGFNTDYHGFGMMMEKSGIGTEGKKAVVLGAGGSANSVIQYLLDNGIRDIVIVSRDKDKAGKKFPLFTIMGYDEIHELKGRDILVNCTPCGMYPNIEGCPVPEEILNNFESAVDLIYNPTETLFIKYARSRGLKAVNGLYMLVGQAVKAQEIWNGLEMPRHMVDDVYGRLSERIGSGGRI